MEGLGGDSHAPGQVFPRQDLHGQDTHGQGLDGQGFASEQGTPLGAGQVPIVTNTTEPHAAPSTDDPGVGDPGLGDPGFKETLASVIFAALQSGDPPKAALTRIAAAVQQIVTGVHASVFFAGSSQVNQPLPGTPVACRETGQDAGSAETSQSTDAARWSKTLRQIAGDSISQRRFASGYIRTGEKTLVAVANPIVVDREVVGVFALVGDSEASRELAQTINVVSGSVAHWWKTQSNTPTAAEPSTACEPTPSNATQASESFLARLLLHKDLVSATQAVADYLCSEFGFEKVFVGFRKSSGTSKLLSISGVVKFSPKSPLTTAAEETLSESAIRNEIAIANTRKQGDALTSGSRELARLSNQPMVVSGPLSGANAAWGAWVGVGAVIPDEKRTTELAALTQSIGPCLHLFHRASGGRLANACQKVCDGVRTKKGMLALLILAALLMLVPMPYRVKCDSELQPVTRRFIPVPYDGVLQEVFVEPGDEIKIGQALARMDGREIEWELASIQADFSQAAKQHDSDLANRDMAAAQVAKLEMGRLSVQMELLKDRLRNLEIKSPIDGVIIGGDPKKKEGARLVQGDSLFEAGPLSNMVAEIYVPDDEVSRVAEGQAVCLQLDAYPGQKWNGSLSRISPSAEVHAAANVFVAEFEIANPQHTLRPGMRGRSRITTQTRPLGWNLFHKAWEQLVYGWGW